MRYFTLATDYDGTIAAQGRVDGETLNALTRLRESGRRLILVSGRELSDLLQTFDRLDIFDLAVLENGGTLYVPAEREEIVLAEPPPARLVDELVRRGVAPISVGKSIIATWHPHEETVLQTIRDLGLENRVIFNKGAVMVLPSGVNKRTGLQIALDRLDLSPHNAVGVGDAENDHAFLSACEFSAAVANALPAVKERVDYVCQADHGAGVRELIEHMLSDDLDRLSGRIARYDIEIGKRENGESVAFKPFGENVLVAGPSGSGKSTIATGIMERIAEREYQFCLIDPEGDYEDFAGAVTLGDVDRAPAFEEILKLLSKPRQNVVVNLLGVKLGDRPGFFAGLLPRLMEMRSKFGRPHWIIIDEAHHLLPRDWRPAPEGLPKKMRRFLMITVHPDMVARQVLDEVGIVIGVGEEVESTFAAFAQIHNREAPNVLSKDMKPGEACVWFRAGGEKTLWVKATPGKLERRRHRRKYAKGEIPPGGQFVFTGPEGKLNLHAQNLVVFLQMGDGVDDETWDFHLRRHDYSEWFRRLIKDDALADATRMIEDNSALNAQESRQGIRKEVEQRYTLPA